MWIMMCYAAVYILEACILWQYCSNLFSSKSPRQGEAVFLFTGYSILFFGSFFDNYRLNLVLFFIVNFAYIFTMYQRKLLSALFHDLFITISMLLSELCICPNLWKQEDVPHSGWSCTGVSDLGAPVGICQMCGYQIIRYAHHMIHPGYRSLTVGCVCAGRMEGDISEAKRREAEFKKATLHR